MDGREVAMLVEDFAMGQRDHVVRAERGYRAFVPPTLPPVLPLSGALMRQLSAADRPIGELAGAGRELPSCQAGSKAPGRPCPTLSCSRSTNRRTTSTTTSVRSSTTSAPSIMCWRQTDDCPSA